eukprot:Amastigsp_a680133_6.p3 type:complete len:217 gc:universal Amastigsp_a680133_6:437-1087(+)
MSTRRSRIEMMPKASPAKVNLVRRSSSTWRAGAIVACLAIWRNRARMGSWARLSITSWSVPDRRNGSTLPCTPMTAATSDAAETPVIGSGFRGSDVDAMARLSESVWLGLTTASQNSLFAERRTAVSSAASRISASSCAIASRTNGATSETESASTSMRTARPTTRSATAVSGGYDSVYTERMSSAPVAHWLATCVEIKVWSCGSARSCESPHSSE